MTELARELGRARRRWIGVVAVACTLVPRIALADDPPPRDVAFQWDYTQHFLRVNVKYRDVIDADTDGKLTRGLPTTILFSASVFSGLNPSAAVSTTLQSCEITWDVWNEVFNVKIMRPEGVVTLPAVLTKEGVIRRCAEASLLRAGERPQVPFGVPLYLVAQVQVDPISPQILQQIQRWISRPTGTATAGPAAPLFSFFTSLFVQRIGNAARQLNFTTKAVVPTVEPPPPSPPPPKP